MGRNWFGLGVVLLIISLVHMIFFDYPGHANYATLEAIWAIACFILGTRAELKVK
ncbi:MAG TPA: hypothetical protein VM118_05505 [Acidobacteriota bacterium]|nr:hypothetical protein [Acidobacteriota bacterium]